MHFSKVADHLIGWQCL